MSKDFDLKGIEAKWRKRWEDELVFESKPDSRERFYLTVAYPYPSGGMHIGHARTYTVPDVIARFKRMQGKNSLYPMAWHVTGTPIIGALKRMKEKEEKQLNVLREVYSMTDEEMESIKEPMDFANYFIDNHYRSSMKALGYAIDWKRQFTTADPHYNAFITWQYKTLEKRGLIKKGFHPVKYCTKDENPVTTHDLLDGEDADIQEFTLLKFPFENGFLIAATLRPETIFGQTNMWVGPDIEYLKADVNGEKWIISRECADKLRLQGEKVDEKEKVRGNNLLGKYCRAPGIERDIIILPSEFCNPAIGSGLVTSVPSDAPYDWIGLKELQENKELCMKYGIAHDDVLAIKVIPIIHTEEYGDDAAQTVVEKMGIKNQTEHDKLKEATQEVYKTGFHSGVMLESCGKYTGMPVARAKDKVKAQLLDDGNATKMLEFSEPVTCRCGGNVVIANAESWFVDYGNEDWKETVRGAIENMKTIPERTKHDYLNTVDWLHQWPCIRNYGLGTKLPFDENFTIEPLSDSTIYMAYYTIAHLISKLDASKLGMEFFDYVFRAEGTLTEVSKVTGFPEVKITEIKESFDYWYPQNWRCSALELIQNHLTFMLFHHVAVFPYDKWPEGIATFGMGLLEGGKMSSSKGNVVLVKTACENHGADVVRLFLMGNAEPWQDFDWRENMVKNTTKKFRQFYEQVKYASTLEGDVGERGIDQWLSSRMQETVRVATESLEGFQTRKALQKVLYGVLNDLSWYSRRAKPNPKVLRDVVRVWVRLMAPFTPHTCEELWEILGEERFVSNAEFPTVDDSQVDVKEETQEEMLGDLMEDVTKITDVTKKKPEKIHLYLAPEWKRKVYEAISEGKTIKDVMSDLDLKPYGKQVAKLMGKRREEIPRVIFTLEDEASVFDDSKMFLEKELGCEIIVEKTPTHDPEDKAKHALPGKPGIYVE